MAQQVVARIVLAQAGNSPPGGYVDGGRDDLVVGAAITCTNADNAGVKGWRWTFTPCAGVDAATYSLSGTEGASFVLTPPAPTGWGDCAVQLEVWGEPLADGRPNKATEAVILGIRLPLSSYADGLPIPNELETSAGGRTTLSKSGGRERRLSESIYALSRQLVDAGLGAIFALRANAGAYLGGNVSLLQGANVTLVQDNLAKTITIAATGGGVTSIQSTDGPDLNTPFSGEIYFEGNGCEVSASNHVFTVIVPPRTRARANAGAYVAGDLSFVGAGGLTVSESAGTFTLGLPTGLQIEDVSGTMTLRRRDANSARRMRFEAWSASPPVEAFASGFEFAFRNEGDPAAIVCRIESDGVRAGAFTQGGAVLAGQAATSVEGTQVTTTSTAWTQIVAWTPHSNAVTTCTIALMHVAALGTVGRTVHTALFFGKNQKGTTADLSVAALKGSYGVKFEIVGNDIIVSVQAPTADATLHVGQVCWESARAPT